MIESNSQAKDYESINLNHMSKPKNETRLKPFKKNLKRSTAPHKRPQRQIQNENPIGKSETYNTRRENSRKK